MRGDEETGAVIAAQIVEEEGPSRDGNTNAGGESGQGEFSAGESGGDGDCDEHGKPVLEVRETQDSVHHAQQRSTMCKLLGEALWVLTRTAKGGHGRQRWSVGIAEGKDGRGESAGKGGYGESDKGAG